MKIAYIAAGAAGMYCGSCIHDNTLAAALGRLGHDVLLVPTYTPIRTDEDDVSDDRVFYGAINVYLQLKTGLFRHTPRVVDWLLDRKPLLRFVSRFAGSTDADELGALALAVLQGEHGPQKKELEKLVDFLRAQEPDLVHITNSLLLGMVARLREALDVPVIVSLQGEDLFIDGLRPRDREMVVAEMRHRANDVSLFVAPSHYYAEVMAELLGTSTDRIAIAPLGIELDGHGSPVERTAESPTIGYLARICPEKGLHLLVDAFCRLAKEPGREALRLVTAGYLGSRDEEYLARLLVQIDQAGLTDRFEYRGEVDREQKIALLRSVDVFAMPTVYREAKGLPILEAMANGVPVVVPNHGSFPEMIEATGGGRLHTPDSSASLAETLAGLIDDRETRMALGAAGRDAVHASFGADPMAEATLAAYHRLTDHV